MAQRLSGTRFPAATDTASSGSRRTDPAGSRQTRRTRGIPPVRADTRRFTGARPDARRSLSPGNAELARWLS
ncbi:hypothetical protein GCM10010140_59350 [Streptosporangium pseudovulgare]|uniref:Uncharacterized protein n=1 Tax=Streptosporangium pseudovulgare TaxID=35765 RepID=A0ABQ2R9X1_9ACTN|nr:hypothetical protein GCM10010140_59350 [Streptosporangium pseudovulgare]